MKAATLTRLAVAGSRTDALRVTLTAGSSALAALTLLAAATVAAVPELGAEDAGSDGWNRQYSSPLIMEPGLRPGVVMALLLLAVPVLALVGQCIRLGAPGRDRRLAAFRLAGATPGQTVLIAATETAAAALAGSLVGLGAYLIVRQALHRPDELGLLPLPTDVLPAAAVLAATVALVPLIGAGIGAVLLRRVIITPLGVVRRTVERSPRLWPGVLIVGGVFAFLVIRPLGALALRLREGMEFDPTVLVGVSGVLLVVLGVVLGTGWIAHTVGRLLHRFGRRPAMLLAGRQLTADPWSGSRTIAALLAGLVVGAGALGYRAYMAAQFAAEEEASRLAGEPDWAASYNEGFYLGAVDLIGVAVAVAVTVSAAGILVAVTESIVSRRRAYAALVATGVPVRTLGEAVAWRTLAPVVPAVLVALTVGLFLVRSPATTATSTRSGTCSGTEQQCADPDSPLWRWTPEVSVAVPVPVADLAMLAGGTFALMLVVVAAGVLLVRRSSDLEEVRVE